MSKFNEMQEVQQEINDAAKRIMKYFSTEICYTYTVEQLLKGQTQIFALMELAKDRMISDPDDELLYITDEIPFFLRSVNRLLLMIKPLAELGEKLDGKGNG